MWIRRRISRCSPLRALEFLGSRSDALTSRAHPIDNAPAVKPYASEVLPQLCQWRREGPRTALVTLLSALGSTPRPVGSQVAVNERGDWLGQLTGGCADAAIVAEAQAAISSGENRCVRFGEGSPYLDVKLPCGSGIDVHFDVMLADADVHALLDAQARRVPASLLIDRASFASRVHLDDGSAHDETREFRRPYLPPTRLAILGKGPMVALLAQLARLAELDVVVLSPDPEVVVASRPHASDAICLTTPAAFRYAGFDAWTGVVSLFHDHDWEPPILGRALASECFYIGALGSRRTQAARLALLREAGCSEASLRRVHGPVGLNIGALSPPEIAVSIIAQVVQVLRRGQTPALAETAQRPGISQRAQPAKVCA